MMQQTLPGRFSGYAAIFDVPDKGRDVIRAGAFAQSLQGRARHDVPLLWQHDTSAPVGVIEAMSEDARGLKVTARLTLDTVHGHDAYALMKDGAVTGLSIGYRVRDAKPLTTSKLRELRNVDLIEVSLVSLPMQPLARLIALS